MYNEKYVKAKNKILQQKVNINFHNNEMPNESLECFYLSVTLLDLVTKKIINIIVRYF